MIDVIMWTCIWNNQLARIVMSWYIIENNITDNKCCFTVYTTVNSFCTNNCVSENYYNEHMFV